MYGYDLRGFVHTPAVKDFRVWGTDKKILMKDMKEHLMTEGFSARHASKVIKRIRRLNAIGKNHKNRPGFPPKELMDPHERYLNNLGEFRARQADARRDMTQKELDAPKNHPFDDRAYQQTDFDINFHTDDVPFPIKGKD